MVPPSIGFLPENGVDHDEYGHDNHEPKTDALPPGVSEARFLLGKPDQLRTPERGADAFGFGCTGGQTDGDDRRERQEEDDPRQVEDIERGQYAGEAPQVDE